MGMARAASTRERSGTPWLWVLIVAAVFTQSGLNLLRPVTSYKLLAFGADSVAVGVATAAYAIIPLAVAIALGRLSDRMLRLRVLLAVGAATLGLAGVGLALAPNLWGVIAASAVLGFGHLAFTIAGQSAIARYSSPRQLDVGFGWFTAAYSVGQLIGPFLGGLIVGSAHGDGRLGAVQTALWVGAAIAAAGTLLFVAPLPGSPRDRRTEVEIAPGPPDDAGEAPAEGEANAAAGHAASGGDVQAPPGGAVPGAPEGRPTVLKIMRRPGVPAAMLAALSLLSMLDILTAFLPVVGEELGIDPGVIGTLLAIRALASIICRAVLPWMVGRVGRTLLMLSCLFGSGATLALPPLALAWWPGGPGSAVATVFLVIGGFFLGIGQPLTMTLISQSVPGAWRGSALAVRLMGNRLGQVLMPLLAGLVAAPWGPAGAIWMTCALLVVSGAASAADARRR
jgi:MFS family permease